MGAAAFGRLCVETFRGCVCDYLFYAAAFGRLCVETEVNIQQELILKQPPSGGCVLKQEKELR